jgi:hypothetical protein
MHNCLFIVRPEAAVGIWSTFALAHNVYMPLYVGDMLQACTTSSFFHMLGLAGTYQLSIATPLLSPTKHTGTHKHTYRHTHTHTATMSPPSPTIDPCICQLAAHHQRISMLPCGGHGTHQPASPTTSTHASCLVRGWGCSGRQ